MVFSIPENIKVIIKENYKLVKKIIEFYYSQFLLISNKSEKFENALTQFEFITKNK